VDALGLSEEKQAELTEYMRVFTSPLLAQVYGDSNADIENFDQLIGMFASPDKGSAMRNLRKLAEKLDIEIMEVPSFLEEYAYIFLSLTYFKTPWTAWCLKFSVSSKSWMNWKAIII
jgi:hypothetical protein